MSGILANLKGKAGIYAVINTVTKRFYIGCTTDFYKRRSHYSCAFRGSGWCNVGLKRDVKTYGREFFVFRVLEEVTPLEAKQPGFLAALEDTYLNAASIDEVYNYTHRRMLRKKKENEFRMTNKKAADP